MFSSITSIPCLRFARALQYLKPFSCFSSSSSESCLTQSSIPSSETKYKIVLLRHGESLWNKENLFTGWKDVQLTAKGIEEAKSAGKALKQKGYEFDVVYTSMLTRAVMTYNNVADELGCHHLPVHKHWRLNERHYGALQGLNKAETAEKHGEEIVKLWRRSYSMPPPALEIHDERFPGNEQRYKHIPAAALPRTESLADCVARVIPYWYDEIVPQVLDGKNVLVVAHGNSLRSIIKYIDNISEEDIIGVTIPTSVPLIYEFDASFKPIKNYFLADPEELKKRQEALVIPGSKR